MSTQTQVITKFYKIIRKLFCVFGNIIKNKQWINMDL